MSVSSKNFPELIRTLDIVCSKCEIAFCQTSIVCHSKILENESSLGLEVKAVRILSFNDCNAINQSDSISFPVN